MRKITDDELEAVNGGLQLIKELSSKTANFMPVACKKCSTVFNIDLNSDKEYKCPKCKTPFNTAG